PRRSISRISWGSAGPGAVLTAASAAHRRYRSWLMSALRTPGLTVSLNERVTVTGARPGLTLATTKRGPIRNSGCGREARNTWPWPAVGAAAQRNAAIATHDLIMPHSSAKVRLRRAGEVEIDAQ